MSIFRRKTTKPLPSPLVAPSKQDEAGRERARAAFGSAIASGNSPG